MSGYLDCLSRRRLQGDQMRAQRLEVDAHAVRAAAGIEFDAIAVLIQGGRRQRHRAPRRIDDRHHEIDRQPVLMGAMRTHAPTLGQPGFAIDVALARQLARQPVICVQQDLAHARMDMGASHLHTQRAIGGKIRAARGQSDGTVDAAGADAAEAGAGLRRGRAEQQGEEGEADERSEMSSGRAWNH